MPTLPVFKPHRYPALADALAAGVDQLTAYRMVVEVHNEPHLFAPIRPEQFSMCVQSPSSDAGLPALDVHFVHSTDSRQVYEQSRTQVVAGVQFLADRVRLRYDARRAPLALGWLPEDWEVWMSADHLAGLLLVGALDRLARRAAAAVEADDHQKDAKQLLDATYEFQYERGV